MTHYLLYLYAESPVHTGAADSIDVLDLPVQRESATGYPVIWGQSLKGALRQAAGDAQLVAMPVPALRHTFAWLTSEIALSRLARKYRVLGREVPGLPEVRSGDGAAASDSWTKDDKEVLGPCLVPLGPSPDEKLVNWAERVSADVFPAGEAFQPFARKFRADLVLAGSDIVPVLLRECTEQAVRVQLNASKTVENGPFYSEYLPAETVMAAQLTLRGNGDTEDNRQALRELLHERLLQIGGDETLGKGLMWGRLVEEGSS